MAHIHSTFSAGKAGLFVLGGIALAAAIAAGVYWSGSPAQAPQNAAATNAAPSASTTASTTASAIDVATPALQPSSDMSAATTEAAMADLQQASQAMAQDPALKPIVGPVTERPPYVSLMEWGMLKGVASQHATPEPELTRLVNSLRFNKQFETWEALPKTAASALQRQGLAKALMADLPERVRHQDIGIQDAQKAMTALLADIEPDAEQRKVLAKDEGLRLLAAVPKTAAPP